MLKAQQASSDLQRLEEFIGQYESAVIAYSGGVDSAVVAMAAARKLGPRALACLGASASLAERERAAAESLAREMHCALRVVATREQDDPRYAANPTDRCYYCKSELYERLAQIAEEGRFAVILDGCNATDLTEDRPGLRARSARGVVSPLAELGFDKATVRALALEMGLRVWNKPATPCLSSRIPHGTPIVPEFLRQVERAENVLAELGFGQFRVRHHGNLARVELSAEDLARGVELRRQIVERVRQAGYTFVTLDLNGFRGDAAVENKL